MSKELNCMNCCIGDFKQNLCDCDNGFCKEFKNIGKEEDFFNAVMQRIRPQGEWIAYKGMQPPEFHGKHYCSNCYHTIHLALNGKVYNFCPNCGAKMDGEREDE